MTDTLAEDLARLSAKATQEDLADGGRYFAESYDDLTQCRHSEIGEYQRSADGELIEALWNAWRAGRLEVKPLDIPVAPG